MSPFLSCDAALRSFPAHRARNGSGLIRVCSRASDWRSDGEEKRPSLVLSLSVVSGGCDDHELTGPAARATDSGAGTGSQPALSLRFTIATRRKHHGVLSFHYLNETTGSLSFRYWCNRTFGSFRQPKELLKSTLY